jgi:hypothetical protein
MLTLFPSIPPLPVNIAISKISGIKFFERSAKQVTSTEVILRSSGSIPEGKAKHTPATFFKVSSPIGSTRKY